MPSPEPKFQESASPGVLALISGRDLLIQHLGHWPTFHDFEVLSITLERAVISAATHDLKAIFFVFDIRRTPDHPERRQGSAEFLFEDVDAVRIAGFNHQNPILGLTISFAEPSEEPRFLVEWQGSSMQHDVSFTCGRISVLRVIDLNPFRKTFPGL
jgi:hypothetical protein